MKTTMRRSRAKKNHIPKMVIARAYAPDLTPGAALNRLNRWMRTCTPLMVALKKASYVENSRKFSKRHIKLIYKYLGEPYA